MIYKILILLLLASSVLGQDITLGGGTNDAMCGTMKSNLADSVFQGGAHTELQCYKNADGDPQEISFIDWHDTLAVALYGYEVDSAKLYLEYVSRGNASENTIYGGLVIMDETQTTWNSSTTGNAWNTGGALGSGIDRTSSAYGTFVYTDADGGLWTLDITALAQTWDNTDTAGAGMIFLEPTGGNNSYLNIRSDDHATTGDHPKIELWITAVEGDADISYIRRIKEGENK